MYLVVKEFVFLLSPLKHMILVILLYSSSWQPHEIIIQADLAFAANNWPNLSIYDIYNVFVGSFNEAHEKMS